MSQDVHNVGREAGEIARPILFSREMVRAVLACTKTQTRRILKHEGIDRVTDRDEFLSRSPHPLSRDPTPGTAYVGRDCGDVVGLRCPYGKPGDLLWVREAWRVGKPHDGKPGSALWPRQDGKEISVFYEAGGWRSVGPPGRIEPFYLGNEPMPDWAGRYRAGRFMPRWASRLTLRITDVRVERLQDISLQDVRAEGCEVPDSWLSSSDAAQRQRTAATVYGELWTAINGAESWDENPFVWCLSFQKIDAASQNADIKCAAA